MLFLKHRLPFNSAIEAEGFELQFSLIAEGVGLGLTMLDALHNSAFRKSVKILKVRDFLPLQCIWLLHFRHIDRMTPAVRCLRDAVHKSLHTRVS
jgi:DNA-binding transcriptional LysR family regulator